jgi:hypothetical protein
MAGTSPAMTVISLIEPSTGLAKWLSQSGLAKRGGRLYSPATNAPFVYRLGLKIFNLARGVRLP